MNNLRRISLLVLATLFIFGCQNQPSAEDGASRCTLGGYCAGDWDGDGYGDGDGSIHNNTFSCSAQPSRSNITENEVISVTISATGGTAPYSIPGSATFGSYAVITKQYSRTGVISDIVSVYDDAGSVATCTFSVNVDEDPLTCSVLASGTQIIKDEETVLALSVVDGLAPFQFELKPSSDASVIYQSSSARGILVPVTYASAGNKTASLKVTSADGKTGVCNRSFTVYDPSVHLTASPSVAQQLDQQLTVVASHNNFPSQPSFAFTGTPSGVAIAQDGNDAVLSVTDGQTHEFTLQVTATLNGIERTHSLALEFIGMDVTCSAPSSASTLEGEELSFEITSSHTLEITEIVPGSGGTQLSSGMDNPIQVSYSTSGAKEFKVKARSAATHGLCNNGNYITVPVQINSPATCSATLSPNPSYTGDEVLASVSISGGSNDENITLESIAIAASAGLEVVENVSLLSRKVTFEEPGTYSVGFILSDSGDSQSREIRCNITHRVRRGTPLCEARFEQNGHQISSARPNENVSLRVDSTLFEGYIELDPGEEVYDNFSRSRVSFPVWAHEIRYKESGVTTATVTVTELGTDRSETCTATLTLDEPMGCTISGDASVTIRQEVHRGYDPRAIFHNTEHSFTATLQNPLIYVKYRFNDGKGNIETSSEFASTSKTMDAEYTKFGNYQAKFDILDVFDIVNSSCSMNVAVNKYHDNYLYRPSNYKLRGRKCWVEIDNDANHQQTVKLLGGEVTDTTAQYLRIDSQSISRSQYFKPGYHSRTCYIRIRTLAAENEKGSLSGRVCLGWNYTHRDNRCWNITQF